MFTVTVISDPVQLPEYQKLWDELSRADELACLFNSYAWAENWIAIYWRPEFELHLVVVAQDESQLAILPLYLNKIEGKYLFLGTGEPELSEVSTEYLDFVIANSASDNNSLCEFIANYLETALNRPLEFVNCSEKSHVVKIAGLCRYCLVHLTGLHFRIELGNRTYDNIASQFSRNHTRKARELINRFEKSQTLTFGRLSSETYAENWNRLRQLHTDDWNERGKPGAFVSDEFNLFHGRMYDRYADIEQQFFAIEENGTPVAINHFYQDNRALYFYSSGTRKGQGTLSLGLLNHLLCLKKLAGKDIVYDFMKGSLRGGYKRKFCAGQEGLFTVTVFPRTPSGQTSYFMAKLRSLLGRISRNVSATLARLRTV